MNCPFLVLHKQFLTAPWQWGIRMSLYHIFSLFCRVNTCNTTSLWRSMDPNTSEIHTFQRSFSKHFSFTIQFTRWRGWVVLEIRKPQLQSKHLNQQRGWNSELSPLTATKSPQTQSQTAPAHIILLLNKDHVAVKYLPSCHNFEGAVLSVVGCWCAS